MVNDVQIDALLPPAMAVKAEEIGVRKVLGATVPHILMLLSREIIYLILAANVLAWPVAWCNITARRGWKQGLRPSRR